MSDMFQSGIVATLHRLGETDLPRLEADLEALSRETPLALVLPCHMEEIGSPALRRILRELSGVRYLAQIVVGIDGAATPSDWRRAREQFAGVEPRPDLLWNDGPRLAGLLAWLREAGIDTGASGKGRNAWLCFGHVFSSGIATAVVAHDCDIATYRRELLARLIYPVAEPSLGFEFCKGYYARATDRLHGRVMRLLFTPLLRALRQIGGEHPLLGYLDAFRYPLAGEFCARADLLRRVRVPWDWSLEIGLLAEVFRNCAPRAICQSELCGNYDHKHRELSPDDPEKGLHRMARDIAGALFRRMAAEGLRLDARFFDSLREAFAGQSEETLLAHRADAAINGLRFDRPEEEEASSTFARAIGEAAQTFQSDPPGLRLLPSWSRIAAEFPSFAGEMLAAVDADREA